VNQKLKGEAPPGFRRDRHLHQQFLKTLQSVRKRCCNPGQKGKFFIGLTNINDCYGRLFIFHR